MMAMQRRRCRTCGARLGLGHFRMMQGGRRSFTCRGCEDGRDGRTFETGRATVDTWGRWSTTALTPTCEACGELTEAATALTVPDELVEPLIAADRAVTEATHRCGAATDVRAEVTPCRP